MNKQVLTMAALLLTLIPGQAASDVCPGAAAATVNRLPVLLLPGDIFARRNVAPVLQQRNRVLKPLETQLEALESEISELEST